ncbi:NYN domain-containing protein [Corynebacterium freiburgense]|uniref:NYN domain-containing protein n=1 Tax=Corynebacterium freiburgense TaxID=556548 RepID=UPI0004097047|nr:NYN domain-containing protein [Corynebacterium freiburgense]WJZ03649.1 6-hydroxy-3-succinoylpyridine 3-monooxygenase HspA [Corynebacterium freiburgense]
MVTRVGVYFDGYNVYYGGRSLFKERTEQWKWYSPRILAKYVVDCIRKTGFYGQHKQMKETWGDIDFAKIVFCSAKISESRDLQALYDQTSYFNAIQDGNHIDHLELGRYVSRVKYAPLAIKGSGGRPEVYHSQWPIKVRDKAGVNIDDATFLVSYFHSEEKGSDVNLATHLMRDVYENMIDAAIVFSNDSDLSLPVEFVRSRVPLGIVNPQGQRPHNSLLKNAKNERGDWHFYLTCDAFIRCQMPDTVGKNSKPPSW